MESNYRNRDFEEYIKQNADQYRMFPSEKVWKGINGTLHTRRKWYGVGLGLLLLMTGTAVTLVMISYPAPKNQLTTLTKEMSSPVQAHFSISKPASNSNSIETATSISPFNNTQAPTSIKSLPAVETGIANISVESPAIEQLQSDKAISLALTDQQFAPPVVKNEKITSIANEVMKPAGVSPDLFPPSSSNEPADVDVAAAPEKSNESTPVAKIHSYQDLPLTIESITNAFQPKTAKHISWQLFFTPTVSYRKLDENKSFDNLSRLSYPFASLTDVNKAVTHKPDIGLQVGLSAGYPVTRNIKIRGGLQFNINRYDIKAFPYNPEIATINLSAATGISSVSTWTPYRNYGGFKSDWLKNFYFSVSAPIGVEVRLIGNDKTSFGIAGTLQPTYIIKDRAYLISTDYKNYAEVPSLIRHVNVNTGFETFVNYTNGRTRWQIGPQVRYQVMSSFHNKYPVKENLFDFGIKIGLMLNE